jgi:hypothetical protein
MQSNVPPVSPSNMVAWTPRSVLVYWVDKQGAVRGCAYSLDRLAGKWEPAFDVAPPGSARAGSRVALGVRSATRIELFWPTDAGAIGSRGWDQTASRWGNLHLAVAAGSVRSDSSVVAISRTEDSIDLFWIGPKGDVLTCQGKDENWSAPQSITGPGAAGAGGGLSGVAPTATRVHIFWSANDGRVSGASRDFADGQSRWTAPFDVTSKGGRARSPVVALSTRPGRIDIFWAGADDAVWSSGWDDGTAGKAPDAPQAVTPPGAISQGSVLHASARLPRHIDIFYVGNSGEVAGAWWDASANQGRWNAPFTVTAAGATRPGLPVAVAARTADHVDLVWNSADGSVSATYWDAANVGVIWAPPLVIAPAA